MKYRPITITCEAGKLLDELLHITKDKQYVYVSELIEEAYQKMKENN